ncbi:MAG: TonB-dependent receptor, partial [Rhodanobacter sp.]
MIMTSCMLTGRAIGRARFSRRPLVVAIRQSRRMAFWCATSLSFAGVANAATTNGQPGTAMPSSSSANITNTKQLEEVEVRAITASAITQAPVQSELDATQPQSVIGL